MRIGTDSACAAAHLDFLVNMTITTDYYMDPRGEFVGVATPSSPRLAIQAVRKEQIPTTIMPFDIVAFDTPRFTYTLLASNYQASPSLIKSIRQWITSMLYSFPFAARDNICMFVGGSTFHM